MSNRLADTTSPYLLQHAHNPVDWWPWCAEALDKARREDKPILLSIGYSACHWCHVMAHESFEDEATAAVMNEHFVNIKVDREERPDLDKIHQNAHYLLTRRPGGWPLTIFLTPELVPFYSGTYFPPEPRHGLPGFRDLLVNVARAYREQKAAITQQSEALREALARLAEGGSAVTPSLLSTAPVEAARKALAREFDARHGGFGQAPKFPHPDNLALLLRGDGEAREMALFTLEKMALGGIHDQLGGGFCRYSVDDRWMIPHFEKMLYDNGPLLALYAEAWKLTGRPLFHETCDAVAGWVVREMQSPEGGYWSSLDADSEGEEGRFYTWTREEVRELLTPGEYAAFAPRFGLDRPPNFEGRWHLHVFEPVKKIAGRLGESPQRVAGRIESARAKLFQARGARVRPGLDDKILTGWNALMIQGMARAGRLLERPDWIESAHAATDFIRRELWRDGRLLAAHRKGVSHLPAYLDDHAWLIQALLELLQCHWDSELLEWAIALAELLLAHFEDRDRGGFWFTADDHEALLQRPKSFTDDATPSGNGIAARALLELARLTGELRYQEAAERTLRAAWPGIVQAPQAHASLLLALKAHLEPDELVIVRGPAGQLAAWQQALLENFRLERTACLIPDEATGLPTPLAAHRPSGDRAIAWICRGNRCLPPVSDPATLEREAG